MGLDFVAIDFETANASRASACAVGLAVVEDGVVTAQDSWLIRPPTEPSAFDRRNIAIHGITAAECAARGISWVETAQRLGDLTAGRVAVAHNAQFDRSVWAAANAESGLDGSTAPFCCTLELSRRAFPRLDIPVLDYKLNTVSAALELPPFRHHDAGADALAAALIVIELAKRGRRDELVELWPSGPKPPAGPRASRAATVLTGAGYRRQVTRPTSGPSLADPSISAPSSLIGQTVLLTGELAFARRDEAHTRIEAAGGRVAKSATRALTLLVIGAGADVRTPPLTGATNKEKGVIEKLAQGQRIAVVGEPELLELLTSAPASTATPAPPMPAPAPALAPAAIPQHAPEPALPAFVPEQETHPEQRPELPTTVPGSHPATVSSPPGEPSEPAAPAPGALELPQSTPTDVEPVGLETIYLDSQPKHARDFTHTSHRRMHLGFGITLLVLVPGSTLLLVMSALLFPQVTWTFPVIGTAWLLTVPVLIAWPIAGLMARRRNRRNL